MNTLYPGPVGTFFIFSDIQRGMLNSVSENEFSPSAKQCRESPDHLILDF